MSKVETVKTAIEEEYDVCYKNLADELIEHNKGILTMGALEQLVEKHSQQFSCLNVVFYDNNITNVALMYHIGDNVFLDIIVFIRQTDFILVQKRLVPWLLKRLIRNYP